MTRPPGQALCCLVLLVLIAVDARLMSAPQGAATSPGMQNNSIRASASSRLDTPGSGRSAGTSSVSTADATHVFSFEGSRHHSAVSISSEGKPLIWVQAAAVEGSGAPAADGRSGQGHSDRQKGSRSSSSSSGGGGGGSDDRITGDPSSSDNGHISRVSSHEIRGATGDSSGASVAVGCGSQQQQAPHANSSSSSGSGSGRVVQVSRRHLQQSGACPEGCAPGFCVPAGNDPTAGFRCQQCSNNLIVDKATGKCACPAGRYSLRANSCNDCLKGHYCEGGVYAANATENQPVMRQCPALMTTLGLRSTSARACVNLPGTYYTISAATGVVGAVTCPVDTYGPGFRKQRACVPCPPNYVTNGLTGRTSPMQCIIPPGFYLKGPGMIAPCPVGEWKDGTGPAGNCTKCAFGVTTAFEASKSAAACAVLLPGFHAAAIAGSGEVTAAAACPQNFYCPSGVPGNAFDPANPDAFPAEPTIQRCPSGTWTQDRGSVSPEQCLTPPGHYTAGGVTSICPDGSFRADWLPPAQAAACTPCGSGVQGDKSDRVTVYNLTTGAATRLPVMTTGGDCFIQPGQGLFFSSLTQTFRARNCEDNEYGAPSRFYGLTTYPCRPCPSGMVASNDSALYPNSSSYWADNGDGTRGFTSERACVTQDGYGYSARIASPCAVGTYNPRDTYSSCSACPTGLTTSGVGAGRTIADCGLAAGYGFHSGAVTACPLGTYNDAAYTASSTTPCTACPGNTTTAAVGSSAASQCDLCVPGFGGASCALKCGSADAPATYGPAGRAVGTACTACETSATGYSFAVGSSNEVYAPQAVSPAGATSPIHCLAEFVQLADAAWWLPTAANTSMVISDTATFEDCVATCTTAAKCQYITYDYSSGKCFTRIAANPLLAGTGWVGFKTVPSSDVGRTWSVGYNGTSAKSSSGQYSWYQDPNAASIGVQSQPSNVATFTRVQDCLDACDDDALNCAGVFLKPASQAVNTPKTCFLIRGDTTLGVNKRSMTRADTTRLALPPL